jgi:hypothetical protein
MLAAVAFSAAGNAYGRTDVLRTQAGSVVHWTRAEITVGVDAAAASRSVDSLYVALAIQLAARAWNQIPASQPRFRFTAEPNRDVTIRFCRGRWRGDSIDLGRSQFSASPRAGTVTAATVEFNECDHKFTPPGESATELYDLQSVMTHELGHVLGLGHGDNSAAIMFPNGAGARARTPDADDETALAVIYLGREPLQHTPAPASADDQTGGQVAQPASGAAHAVPGGPAGVVHAALVGVDKTPAEVAPVDSVSVLNLKANGGRQIMVYTCEPTLLPAMAESQPGKAKRPSGRTTSR